MRGMVGIEIRATLAYKLGKKLDRQDSTLATLNQDMTKNWDLGRSACMMCSRFDAIHRNSFVKR
jgi:hypothetical protein